MSAPTEKTIKDALDATTLTAGHPDYSLAAINRALGVTPLHLPSPHYMFDVMAGWIDNIDQCIPDAMRNDPRWKGLLARAGFIKRQKELEMLAIAVEQAWAALAMHQPSADELHYGDEWSRMLVTREILRVEGEHPGNFLPAHDEVPRKNLAPGAGLALAGLERAIDVLSGGSVERDLHKVALGVSWCSSWCVRWLSGPRTEQWNLFDPCGVLARMLETIERTTDATK